MQVERVWLELIDQSLEATQNDGEIDNEAFGRDKVFCGFDQQNGVGKGQTLKQKRRSKGIGLNANQNSKANQSKSNLSPRNLDSNNLKSNNPKKLKRTKKVSDIGQVETIFTKKICQEKVENKSQNKKNKNSKSPTIFEKRKLKKKRLFTKKKKNKFPIEDKLPNEKINFLSHRQIFFEREKRKGKNHINVVRLNGNINNFYNYSTMQSGQCTDSEKQEDFSRIPFGISIEGTFPNPREDSLVVWFRDEPLRLGKQAESLETAKPVLPETEIPKREPVELEEDRGDGPRREKADFPQEYYGV